MDGWSLIIHGSLLLKIKICGRRPWNNQLSNCLHQSKSLTDQQFSIFHTLDRFHSHIFEVLLNTKVSQVKGMVIGSKEGRLHNACCEKQLQRCCGHNLGRADVFAVRFEVPQLSWWVSWGLPMRETSTTNTTKIKKPTMPHQQQSTRFEQPEQERVKSI